jgi:hypothetical protein
MGMKPSNVRNLVAAACMRLQRLARPKRRDGGGDAVLVDWSDVVESLLRQAEDSDRRNAPATAEASGVGA